MCSFIVGLPLDVGFEMDLGVVSAVWHSDIDLVMLEDWLQDYEDHSWYLVLLGDVVGLASEDWLCIKV
jgi:hypothetical protein